MYSSRTKNWFHTHPRFTLWSSAELPALPSTAGLPRRLWGRRVKMHRTTGSNVLATAGRWNRSPIVKHKFEKTFPFFTTAVVSWLTFFLAVVESWKRKKDLTDEFQIYVLLDIILLMTTEPSMCCAAGVLRMTHICCLSPASRLVLH